MAYAFVYIDDSADIKLATSIAVNSKAQRPGVCNTMETLLVNKKIAKKFLPVLEKELNHVKKPKRYYLIQNQ